MNLSSLTLPYKFLTKIKNMNYSLVLQIPESALNFDQIIDFENLLINHLSNDNVDGHDFGSGEINFFIYTNNPKVSFNLIKLFSGDLLKNMKVAYRKVDSEVYDILYPESLQEFRIQ